MVAQSSSVCVVGSFALDSIVVPSMTFPFCSLGGAATYTSIAVKTLGESVSVVSRVGADFPDEYLWQLREKGIDISNVKRYLNETTTRFELCYNNDFSERTLKLICRSYPINLDDIPIDLHAKIIHIAPIAGEFNFEVVEHLKSCCDFLSLDPQGFLRSFNENGNVIPKLSIGKCILSLVDVCKLSLDELFVLTGLSELKMAVKTLHDIGVKTVIVTMGAKGSLLSIDGALYNVPACTSTIVVDPTGAGDVFIGAFLAEYLQGKDPLWCACVGSAAASFVVESIGSSFRCTKDQIYQRTHKIWKQN
jgi:sugar/nucleoside kinase (ribokinase family)